MHLREQLPCLLLLVLISNAESTDVTSKVFGSVTDGMPAAFGDFDSDELMDVFVLRNNGKSVEILLGSEEEPLLRPARPVAFKCPSDHKFSKNDEQNAFISSVVPGDFDGDALMDLLVTTVEKKTGRDDGTVAHTSVFIHWGGGNYLNCSNVPLFTMIGQPLALDYNQDMIIDLFGLNINKQRVFWIFDQDRSIPLEIPMESRHMHDLIQPHAHAYLDLNKDNMADLFVTTTKDFEVWYGEEMNKENFVFNRSIPHPKGHVIGQSFFMDFELQGQMDLLTPVCVDESCKQSQLFIYTNDEWHDLQIDFKDNFSNVWGFALRLGSKYTNAITMHSGDFNMDGYPDLLATLQLNPNSAPQSFLLENVPCETACGRFTRTFKVRWNALNPFGNGSVMAVFYDFYQDGILDVMLVLHNGTDYRVAAFQNSLDYDANFIKVMVLTGLTNKNNHMIDGRVGKKRRTYGTNLPGPSISYRTTQQDGTLRHAMSPQLPQSAHFSLNLPYTIFGLGRTPNFVDSLQVGLSNHSRDWPQIIPNSQMVVIPWPTDQPAKWKAQLFVTPSKVILTSVAALTGVCGLITIIIGVLHWKERQEDKKERQQESHRFHFDAM